MTILAATPPLNDDCASATPIDGLGIFPFNTTGATTDGWSWPGCFDETSTSQITRDVWFSWLALEDGSYVIETCNGTTLDTRIAIYNAEACPQDEIGAIACDDDACLTQSRIEFDAVAGTDFLLRIGSYPGLGGGSGSFTIRNAAAIEPFCGAVAGQCRSRGLFDAALSDGATQVVADDFKAKENGKVDSVCIWGAYLDADGHDCFPKEQDEFEIRYYDHAESAGSPIAGPFLQTEGTLQVVGPALTGELLRDANREYLLTFGHAPVPVAAEGCYWIEVLNRRKNGCQWHWELAPETPRGFAGRDRDLNGFTHEDLKAGDMAFCLNVAIGSTESCRPRPANDEREGAIPIGEGITQFDTSSASMSPWFLEWPTMCVFFPYPNCCKRYGEYAALADVWYEYTAPCDGLLSVDTCDTEFDTRLGFEDWGENPPSNYGGCSEDQCGPDGLQSSLLIKVGQNRPYILHVGGYTSRHLRQERESDCFYAHEGVGCDDQGCTEGVCQGWYSSSGGGPWCCLYGWDESCAKVAREFCGGHGGPGRLYLHLSAIPPSNETLRSYSGFLSCFSGGCASPPCGPLLDTTCCMSRDYDNDGDVDADDYQAFHAAIDGPP